MKKRLLKIVSVMLALVLCLTCLSGCGDSGNSGDSSAADEGKTALTVIGASQNTDYTLEMCNLFFAQGYYDFLATYGSMASYFGLDTSTGLIDLKSQSCNYSSDGTWHGYFIEYATMSMTQITALCDYATANGISINDEMKASIDEQIESTEAAAKEKGYSDIDSFLSAYYGKGVTSAHYRKYLEMVALADEVYYGYVNSLSYTDEEIEANYPNLGYEEGENDYNVASMRHILIMAEADENGEYTDEAIKAAHDRIEEIYAEWKAGAMTEESFAELAEKYSDDGGSNTNGGLYENIYNGQMIDGINDWLFVEKPAVGDTTIVDNNGSYVGTHIVYMAGYGELYSTILSRQNLRDTDTSAWMETVTTGYGSEEGEAYAEVGVFEA